MRDTLHEERQEAWNGLLDGMRQSQQDPAREAACAFLLRHLIDSMRACAR